MEVGFVLKASVHKRRLNESSWSQFHVYCWVNISLAKCLNIVLNVKALVGPFKQEKAPGLLRDYEPSGGPSFEALMLTVFPRWVVSGPTPAQQQMVVAETCLGQVHNAGPVCQVHILYLHIYIYTIH